MGVVGFLWVDVPSDLPLLNPEKPQDVGRLRRGVGNYLSTCSSCVTVDGRWGLWSHWSLCSATCNRGTRTRERQCDSPPPRGQGVHCEGDSTTTSSCKDRDCGTPSKLLHLLVWQVFAYYSLHLLSYNPVHLL